MVAQHGSSVISALASGARGTRFDPRSLRGKFQSQNTLSPVSFAGMTLDKIIVLRIGTLTGCPLCRESHPLCRLKNPTVIKIWLLLGFHPATGSVQCNLPIMLESKCQEVYREREKTQTAFKAMVVELKKEEKGAIDHHPPIDRTDLLKLYNYFYENRESPVVLQSKVFVDVSCISAGGEREFEAAQIADIWLKTDPNGLKYLCIERGELTSESSNRQ